MKLLQFFLFFILPGGLQGQFKLECDWAKSVAMVLPSNNEGVLSQDRGSISYLKAINASRNGFQYIDQYSGNVLGQISKNSLFSCLDVPEDFRNSFDPPGAHHFEDNGNHFYFPVLIEVFDDKISYPARASKTCYRTPILEVQEVVATLPGKYILLNVKKNPYGEIFAFYRNQIYDLTTGKDLLIFKLTDSTMVLTATPEISLQGSHDVRVSRTDFYPHREGFTIIEEFCLVGEDSYNVIRKIDFEGNVLWNSILTNQSKTWTNLTKNKYRVTDKGEIYILSIETENLIYNGEEVFPSIGVSSSELYLYFLIIDSNGKLEGSSSNRDECLSSSIKSRTEDLTSDPYDLISEFSYNFDFQVVGENIHLLVSTGELWSDAPDKTDCSDQKSGLTWYILDFSLEILNSADILSTPLKPVIQQILDDNKSMIFAGVASAKQSFFSLGKRRYPISGQIEPVIVLGRLTKRTPISKQMYYDIESIELKKSYALPDIHLQSRMDSIGQKELTDLTTKLLTLELQEDSMLIDLSAAFSFERMILDSTFTSLMEEEAKLDLAIDSMTLAEIDLLSEGTLSLISQYDSTDLVNPYDNEYHIRVLQKLQTIDSFLKQYPIRLINDNVYYRSLSFLLASAQNILSNILNFKGKKTIRVYFHFEQFIDEFEYFYPDDFKGGSFGYTEEDTVQNATCAIDNFFLADLYRYRRILNPKDVRKSLVFFEAIDSADNQNATLNDYQIYYAFSGCYVEERLCGHEANIPVLQFGDPTSPSLETIIGANFVMWLSQDVEVKTINKKQLKDKVERYGKKLYSASDPRRRHELLLKPRGLSRLPAKLGLKLPAFLVIKYDESELVKIFERDIKGRNLQGLKLLEDFKKLVFGQMDQYSDYYLHYFNDQIFLSKNN